MGRSSGLGPFVEHRTQLLVRPSIAVGHVVLVPGTEAVVRGLGLTLYGVFCEKWLLGRFAAPSMAGGKGEAHGQALRQDGIRQRQLGVRAQLAGALAHRGQKRGQRVSLLPKRSCTSRARERIEVALVGKRQAYAQGSAAGVAEEGFQAGGGVGYGLGRFRF